MQTNENIWGKNYMEQVYSLNYMLKLMKSFCDNRASDYMFIKHYNTLSLPETEVAKIIDEAEEEFCFLYYKYSKHQMLEPYQPFLGWVRKLYYEYFKDESPEQFVKNAKVYPLQQYSVAEYIRTGKADRMEDILINELSYESKRMLDSLVNIYKYICSKVKVFIVIESLHLTNLSGIKALHRLMNINCPGKFRLAATYNESYHIPGYIEADWNEFVAEMEKQGYQYEWGEVNAAVTIDAQDIFIPKEDEMEGYLAIARNMYFFICHQDAQYYLNIIYDKIKHSNLHITQEQYARFLQLLALTEMHCKEYSKALQLCEYLGVIGRETNDNRLLYNYNYLCAMTQFGMEQLENKITGYTDRCREIARIWGDELAEYKPQVLQLMSDCNYWRDIYIDYYGKYVNDDLIEKTERFGFKNILAYIYIYCFTTSQEELQKVVKHKEELFHFNRGIELATEIENYELLISAYTKNIVVFSRAGYYDYAAELFEKKAEAVAIEKNLIRVVHAYNGLGYNASVTEKYQKAEEYFSNSIEQLLKIGNGEEIAITLYNSALNKMLAREYAYASDDLLLLIKVMEILGIHALSIADTARFYGMLGICSFYIGEDYRCCYCLNKIEAYVSHLGYVEDDDKYHYWLDTLFMKYILEAMMAVSDGKLSEAKLKFEEAKTIMDMDKEKRYFSYLLYVQEVAKYYELIGEEAKRQNILQEGIAFCDQYGYRLRSSILMTELRKGREGNRKGIVLKRSVSNEEILEAVENIALHQKVEEGQKDISFLTIWQELLGQCKKAKDVMPHTFNLLKNHFNFDGVFMVGVNDNSAWMEYKECPCEEANIDNVTNRVHHFTEDDLNGLANYFRENKNAILTNRVEKGFLEYRQILEIIGLYQVVTLFAAPLYRSDGALNGVLIGYVEMRKYAIPNRYLLKENDLVILKFASEQLQSALERLTYMDVIQKMNEQLSSMAVTDQLTGLYNRQGFEKNMQEWGFDKGPNKVIIYIDLDNFKYYNDNFGHELGDCVLVRFAQVLKETVKNVGYAVRYGGDEFVLVLNEKDVEFGKTVAQSIFDKLEKEVLPDIREQIGVHHIIPEEKRLSCSVGIAGCKESSDITEALSNADKALYYIKKSTKNNYMVWDEL